MGSRGPKPKPTRLKIIEGTFRPDRVPPDAVQDEPVTEIVPAPAFLGGDARKEWQRLMPKLVKLKLFSPKDTDALVEYCQALSVQRDAALDIQTRGNIIEVTRETKKGEVYVSRETNPSIDIFAKMHAIVHRGIARFGLSPADATRVSPSGTPSKSQSRFNRYRNGKE